VQLGKLAGDQRHRGGIAARADAHDVAGAHRTVVRSEQQPLAIPRPDDGQGGVEPSTSRLSGGGGAPTGANGRWDCLCDCSLGSRVKF
jgi:hypothetical protein